MNRVLKGRWDTLDTHKSIPAISHFIPWHPTPPTTFFLPSVPGWGGWSPSIPDIPPGALELRHWKAEPRSECQTEKPRGVDPELALGPAKATCKRNCGRAERPRISLKGSVQRGNGWKADARGERRWEPKDLCGTEGEALLSAPPVPIPAWSDSSIYDF